MCYVWIQRLYETYSRHRCVIQTRRHKIYNLSRRISNSSIEFTTRVPDTSLEFICIDNQIRRISNPSEECTRAQNLCSPNKVYNQIKRISNLNVESQQKCNYIIHISKMTVETHMNVKHMWSSYQLLNYIKHISISNNTMISKGISNINYTIPEHSAHTRRIQDTDV